MHLSLDEVPIGETESGSFAAQVSLKFYEDSALMIPLSPNKFRL